MEFRRIMAMFMAILVLWSSSGAAIYKHFCRTNNILTTSMYVAENCSMEEANVAANADCCKGIKPEKKIERPTLSDECCETNSDFIKTISEALSGNVLTNTWQQVVKVLPFLPTMFSQVKIEIAGLNNISSSPPNTIFLNLDSGDIFALLQVYRC